MAKFALIKLRIDQEMTEEMVDVSSKATEAWKEFHSRKKALNIHISATIATDKFSGLTIEAVNDAIRNLLTNVEI